MRYALLELKEQLPVVTREIGDTWIHGIGADPDQSEPIPRLVPAAQHLDGQWEIDAG